MGFLFLFLCVSLLDNTESDTERLSVKRWDARHGLDHGTVTTLFLDDDGLLWVGSQWGLVRFDGRTVLKARGLPPGRVAAITGSSDEIWTWVIGAGLFRQEAGAGFRPFETPLDVMAETFLFQHRNAPWMLQEDRLYRVDEPLDQISIPGNARACSPRDDGIWLLVGKQLLLVGESGRIARIGSAAEAQVLLAAQSGDVWLGVGTQMVVFDRDSGSRVAHASVGGTILGLAEQDGWLWVRHEAGLAR